MRVEFVQKKAPCWLQVYFDSQTRCDERTLPLGGHFQKESCNYVHGFSTNALANAYLMHLDVVKNYESGYSMELR